MNICQINSLDRFEAVFIRVLLEPSTLPLLFAQSSLCISFLHTEEYTHLVQLLNPLEPDVSPGGCSIHSVDWSCTSSANFLDTYRQYVPLPVEDVLIGPSRGELVPPPSTSVTIYT